MRYDLVIHSLVVHLTSCHLKNRRHCLDRQEHDRADKQSNIEIRQAANNHRPNLVRKTNHRDWGKDKKSVIDGPILIIIWATLFSKNEQTSWRKATHLRIDAHQLSSTPIAVTSTHPSRVADGFHAFRAVEIASRSHLIVTLAILYGPIQGWLGQCRTDSLLSQQPWRKA